MDGQEPNEVDQDRLGMTEEQWQRFQAWTHGYGRQDVWGVDAGSIAANLELTPTERLERHQRALALMLEVRRAGAAAGLSPPHRDPDTE